MDVLDIGMIGTEMLYYAVGELGLDGGATIAASHNPRTTPARRSSAAGRPVGGDSGLLEIRDRALSLADVSRVRPVDVSRRATSTPASPTRSCPSSTRAR